MMCFMSKRGEKNYDRCPHKEVEYTYRGVRILGATLLCPKMQDEKRSVQVRADGLISHASRDRELRNRTQSWTWNKGQPDQLVRQAYNDQETATAHLRRSAGELACGGCDYSRLSIVEVSIRRADGAEEKLQAALNDQRRLESEIALNEALSTVNSLETTLREVAAQTEITRE